MTSATVVVAVVLPEIGLLSDRFTEAGDEIWELRRDDARERANWPGIREVQLVEHRTVWSGEGDDFKVERTVTVLDTFRRAR